MHAGDHVIAALDLVLQLAGALVGSGQLLQTDGSHVFDSLNFALISKRKLLNAHHQYKMH